MRTDGSHPLTRAAAAATALLLAFTPPGASAKNLGSLSTSSLGSWNVTGGTGDPTVLAWSSLTGTDGASPVGQSLNGIGTWTSSAGSWKFDTNRAYTSSASSLGNLTMDANNPNGMVAVTLILTTSPQAGVLANSTGTIALIAVYTNASGGTVKLNKFTGSTTTLATTTGVGTPSSAEIRLDSRSNTIKVWFAGVQRITYTLTAGEVTQFKTASNDQYGLFADVDNTTRFDDFHVDA